MKKRDHGQSRKPEEKPPLPPNPKPAVRPCLLLNSSWRSLDWSQRDHMRDCLERLTLSNPAAFKLRILVLGQVGAGKSSFTNSICSIFKGRIACPAPVERGTNHSFTKTFQSFRIKSQQHGPPLPFVFCDTMGLEEGEHEGVKTEDIIKVLKGHVKDGYTFNPVSSISEDDQYYIGRPKLSDKIHCLVTVMPANKVSYMSGSLYRKMEEVIKATNALGIPHVVLVTMIDIWCTQVAKDIRLVYRSALIKQKMDTCSDRLGVPMTHIFPVKNYHEEIDLDSNMDVLLLSALTHILNYANDHVAGAEATTRQTPKTHTPQGNTDDGWI